MRHRSPAASDQTSWKQLIAQTRSIWLTATAVGGALALIVGFATARYWEATQAVVVRQDAVASNDRPGKFADLYEMRTVQETILELARSRQVISATLGAVDDIDPAILSADDLDSFRSRMKMAPPGGAEFGKTEVFYLSVQDKDRLRALRLVAQLCEQLDLRLRQLRADQARGMIAEIEGQLLASEQLLATETARLAEFETKIGADLGELRMLHAAWSGQSDLRQRYVELGADFRGAQEAVQEIERLLELLEATADDPNQLASLPNSLLSAQPTLRRLKDGLVDAQLRTSRLQGARSEEHPRVVAAVEAEASMRRDLVQEIVAARYAAVAELTLRKSRQTAAQERLRQMEQRLSELAEQRAEYSNLVATSERSQESVDQLRGRLAGAQALLAATENSSVLNLVDLPETGPSPSGPSRATILLVGLLGGLTVGVGIVFYQQAPEVAIARTPTPTVPQADRYADRRSTAVTPIATTPVDVPIQPEPVEAESPVVREWWETSPTEAPDTSVSAEPRVQPTPSPLPTPIEPVDVSDDRKAGWPSHGDPGRTADPIVAPPAVVSPKFQDPKQGADGPEENPREIAPVDAEAASPLLGVPKDDVAPDAEVNQQLSQEAQIEAEEKYDDEAEARAQAEAEIEQQIQAEVAAEIQAEAEAEAVAEAQVRNQDEAQVVGKAEPVGDAGDSDESLVDEASIAEEDAVPEDEPNEEVAKEDEPTVSTPPEIEVEVVNQEAGEQESADDDAAESVEETPAPASAASTGPPREPEPVTSGVETGFASLGLDSAGLKDAMRDAFAPSR